MDINVQDIFKDLIETNVIQIRHESHSPDEDDQPIVKRRRQQQSPLSEIASGLSAIESVAGPSNPQVVTPVKTARRRLKFGDEDSRMQLSPHDSSSTISEITIPFEDLESDVELTELLPLHTSTPLMSSRTQDQPRSEKLLPIKTNLEAGADAFDLLRELEYIPSPLSPLPSEEIVVGDHRSQQLSLGTLIGVSLSPGNENVMEEHSVQEPQLAPTLHIHDESEDQSLDIQESRVEEIPDINPAVEPEEHPSLADKHPVLAPCTCKLECILKIPENRRREINREFWIQTYNLRKEWIFQHCHQKTGKRSSIFTLPTTQGESTTVCQIFFLRTLGYTSNSVMRTLKKTIPAGAMFSTGDKRGAHKPAHATPDYVLELIDLHIESFHPAVSPYRREHAPNRRYMSPDTTIKEMHQLFKELYPAIQGVGYDLYRKRVHAKNKVFSTLGNEQCEICLEFSHHEHKDPELDPACETCLAFMGHKERARISRQEYDKDREKDPQPGTEIFVSADMQKVMMLPCMPGIKTCLFTNRLVAFHETFAPLGSQKKKNFPRHVISVMWHEAISGRQAADVTSAFIKAITEMANDATDITIWCDNCSGQNKNWYLYTSLARFMNDEATSPLLNSVTLKYLETGHTFLSCDSFHGLVERNIRKRGSILNFTDLVAAVQTAGGGPKILAMEPEDFREWDKRVTSGKTVRIPKLKDMQVVKFEKNSKMLFYKVSHNDLDFTTVDFLMKKTQSDIDKGVGKPKCRETPRGVPSWKKKNIVSDLCNLMPEIKTIFWTSLATDDTALDLTVNRDSVMEVDQ